MKMLRSPSTASAINNMGAQVTLELSETSQSIWYFSFKTLCIAFECLFDTKVHK